MLAYTYVTIRVGLIIFKKSSFLVSVQNLIITLIILDYSLLSVTMFSTGKILIKNICSYHDKVIYYF